jgi:hypothetical protein
MAQVNLQPGDEISGDSLCWLVLSTTLRVPGVAHPILIIRGENGIYDFIDEGTYQVLPRESFADEDQYATR